MSKRRPKRRSRERYGDQRLHEGEKRLIYELDLHGLTWQEAQWALHKAPKDAVRHKARILKIIHGWGRSTGSSVLQENVRSWLARNPFRFRAAIPGERYHQSDETTMQMRGEIGDFPDADFNRANRGITVVWLR